MSERAEAVVEKVAIAIFQWDIEEQDEPKPIWTGLNDVQRDVWRSGATAALDALGAREETQTIYRNGDGFDYILVSAPHKYEQVEQKRLVIKTPWEDV